jgi:hypothetical protein
MNRRERTRQRAWVQLRAGTTEICSIVRASKSDSSKMFGCGLPTASFLVKSRTAPNWGLGRIPSDQLATGWAVSSCCVDRIGMLVGCVSVWYSRGALSAWSCVQVNVQCRPMCFASLPPGPFFQINTFALSGY